MADWSEGYVKGIDYHFACYPELNPTRARLPFLKAGLRFPERIETACELGFGFGLSPSLHAAASTTEWWGTDFNPTQAAFARELAVAGGGRAHLVDEAFADFCHRQDLPDFDFIGLHGVWTWVSEANRSIILAFLRRKLKPGGVVYASYNTLPGWSQIVPLRRLLLAHAERMSPQGLPISARIEAAVAFAAQVLGSSSEMAKLYPLLQGRLDALATSDASYLAHEYFNQDWDPMPFSEIAERMGDAKLAFGCSADYAHHFDTYNLIESQGQFLATLPDPILRETTRDFMINRQFRKDYWIKGPRPLTAAGRASALRAHRVLLVVDPAAVTPEAGGALAQGKLDEALAAQVAEALGDHRPMSLEELHQSLAPRGHDFDQVFEAVMILIGSGQVASVAEEAATGQARENSLRFNRKALAETLSGRALPVLASPITGGGITVTSIHQLFLLALDQGHAEPADWAQFTWQHFLAVGTRLVSGGRMMESAEENLAALCAEAATFANKRLPALRALGIAE